MTDIIEAMKASNKIEQSGEFGEIIEKMETQTKVSPQFKGAFLVIIKLKKTQSLWDNNDVIDKEVTRTMYRKMNSLKDLGTLSAKLKIAAKEDADRDTTTTLSIVSCFEQDEKGQITGVEKYGTYGLQEWKVVPKK